VHFLHYFGTAPHCICVHCSLSENQNISSFLTIFLITVTEP